MSEAISPTSSQIMRDFVRRSPPSQLPFERFWKVWPAQWPRHRWQVIKWWITFSGRELQLSHIVSMMVCVCVRVCVCACVRGCVGAWVRGCVGAWVGGCVHACMRACVGGSKSTNAFWFPRHSLQATYFASRLGFAGDRANSFCTYILEVSTLKGKLLCTTSTRKSWLWSRGVKPRSTVPKVARTKMLSSDPHPYTLLWHGSDIPLSGIYSDILSDILSGMCIWHIFWHSFWHSGGEHCAPELAVEVRRGTLWSWACCSGPAGNTAI